MTQFIHQTNSQLDLVFERIVDIAPELIWTAWTTPEHLKPWFTPVPWKTIDCEIDLRPGGLFRTVMSSPDGQEFPNQGCYLEIIPNKKLVWTNALEPGYRPANPSVNSNDTFFFTAIISLEPQEQGTKYTAIAMHGTEEGCKTHRDMGFQEGWGQALAQLVSYMKGI
ncbi:MAG: SRPBCC family protein [Leptolyngbya sp. Prado105]|nr:SRPBCC family protein [Leptolyngbya sp. Prado105]